MPLPLPSPRNNVVCRPRPTFTVYATPCAVPPRRQLVVYAMPRRNTVIPPLTVSVVRCEHLKRTKTPRMREQNTCRKMFIPRKAPAPRSRTEDANIHKPMARIACRHMLQRCCHALVPARKRWRTHTRNAENTAVPLAAALPRVVRQRRHGNSSSNAVNYLFAETSAMNARPDTLSPFMRIIR